MEPMDYIDSFNCLNCSKMQECQLAEEIADAKGAVVCAAWEKIE